MKDVNENALSLRKKQIFKVTDLHIIYINTKRYLLSSTCKYSSFKLQNEVENFQSGWLGDVTTKTSNAVIITNVLIMLLNVKKKDLFVLM